MVKSLGEFNISQSSSADIHNITWSQRNPRDMDIPKKRKTRKISPTNIIYTTKIKIKQAVKIFKIKENYKSKKKNSYKFKLFCLRENLFIFVNPSTRLEISLPK